MLTFHLEKAVRTRLSGQLTTGAIRLIGNSLICKLGVLRATTNFQTIKYSYLKQTLA